MELLSRAVASSDAPDARDDSALCAEDFRYEIMAETLSDEYRRHFTAPSFADGLAKFHVNGGPCVLSPEFVKNNADKVFNFQAMPDDVWIVTFPKCGTTWTQEMVWTLLNLQDFQGEKSRVPQTTRSPYLEMSLLSDMSALPEPLMQIFKQIPDIYAINRMKSPRVIKSHLPLYALPSGLVDTCKVVYVARNPKDVIVSYYFHHRLFTGGMEFSGTVKEFAEFFMNDQVWYAPFFSHLLDAWSKREHPNVYFLFYEDMKQDLRGTVQKVAKFLGKPIDDDALLESVVNHLTFECMSKNTSINFNQKIDGFTSDGQFLRKGKTGDWKNHFDQEFVKKLDEWIAANLSNTDLVFKSELDG